MLGSLASRPPLRRHVARTLMVLPVAVSLAVPSLAQAATAADSRFQPNLEATVRYLQEAQQEDGGFAEPGTEPSPDFTAWVTLALAAAGINPRDQTTARQHYGAGHSAYTYLAEHAHEASLTTDFERELLVVDAAGASPRDFGGVDLVGQILGRQIEQGSEAGAFPHQAGSPEAGVNDTIFAILALSPVHELAVEEAVSRAAQWLEAEQNCDGSWPTTDPRVVRPCRAGERRLLLGEPEGEVDMTAAAVEALQAAGHSDPDGLATAFAFLREAQTEKGGFAEFSGGTEPNVASTAWVVQAMWSAGINPEDWTTHPDLTSDEPLGYLASMQQPDGHIRWEASQELNGMWMTAYVTPAFTGNPLPILPPAYDPLPALPPEESTGDGATPPAAAAPGSGDGGVSGERGKGVIAGGGGTHAPLFSRPQPNSKGHTPGGARQLEGRKPAHGKDAQNLQRRNPGRARRKAAPTISGADRARHRVSHPSTVAGKGAGPDGGAAGASVGRGNGGASLPGEATRSGQAAAGQEVNGVLIGDPSASDASGLLEAGAPGLHSAGAGGDEAEWPMAATVTAIALLMIAGVLIERRRPQRIL